jgi:hypothetical protein
MKLTYIILLIMMISSPLHAQLVDDMADESKLYAESKQVNQFFRRFNGEEDEKGNRLYQKDKPYRSLKLRKQYLGILFDNGNAGMSAALKTEFTKQVLEKNGGFILDFHGPGWFSEVQAEFTMNGKPQPVTLFMELEKDHLGYKWVISKVNADMFKRYYQRDTTVVGKFLHPLSHELDFMNLRKAFATSDSISQYTSKKFVPDHLSVFLYEVQKGNLKFQSVSDVKFHFFQVDGWYFELSDISRPGYNTGWLISNLVRLNNDDEKTLLRRFLYHEAN